MWPGCAGDNPCSGHRDTASCRGRWEGRAGLCPWQQGAATLAQAFCESCGRLLGADSLWLGQLGCDRMLSFSLHLQELDALKSIKIFTLLHFWPVNTKRFPLPEADFGLQDRHSVKLLHKREQGKYVLPFLVLRQKPNNSHLFSHCATEPSFSNGLVANFSESSAKGTYLVMGFSYVF